MTKTKKILALLLALTMVMVAFTACSGGSDDGAASGSESASASAEESADDGGEDAGFTEIPIFEDEEVGFMNVAAVYFQPVDMSDGTKAEDYDIHLEADVAALENNFGYPKDSWIPYMTVDYKVEDKDGKTAAEGVFMEMAASDGPHYGANVKLPDAGEYKLTLTFHSPAENDYLLHTDAETGPGAKSFDEVFEDGKLSLTMDWNYEGPVKL